jgi:predicted RNA polymerase sigma factor
MEHKTAGDVTSAWQVLEALLADHPDYVAAYAPSGEVLLTLGRRDEARALYGKGIEAAERKHEPHARDHLESLLADLDSDG